MGYDQFLRFTISKKGCDAETLKIALSLSFPEFWKKMMEYNEAESTGDEIIFSRDGRWLYERGGLLFEEFSAQEISEKIGCTINIYYEGEEKEDAEMITYENGVKTEHKVLGWVDAE